MCVLSVWVIWMAKQALFTGLLFLPRTVPVSVREQGRVVNYVRNGPKSFLRKGTAFLKCSVTGFMKYYAMTYNVNKKPFVLRNYLLQSTLYSYFRIAFQYKSKIAYVCTYLTLEQSFFGAYLPVFGIRRRKHNNVWFRFHIQSKVGKNNQVTKYGAKFLPKRRKPCVRSPVGGQFRKLTILNLSLQVYPGYS